MGVHTRTRGKLPVYPYWTMLQRLQLAFTTYVLCVRLRALRSRYIHVGVMPS